MSGKHLSAEVEYSDANLRMNVKSTEVTSVLIAGTHARISGRAGLNGRDSVDFIVDLDDLGKPGAGFDKFRIQLSNGYDQSGELKGGDIRIRARPCEARDDDDRDDDRVASLIPALDWAARVDTRWIIQLIVGHLS